MPLLWHLPLVAKRLAPVLDIEPAVVSLASLPAVLASSPTGLVSSSAVLALMFIERFQFTAAGKLLVDKVQIDLSATASTALLVATGQPPALVFEPAVVSSVSVVPMVRFQLTTAGKLLLGTIHPFVHLQRSAALRNLYAVAFRSLLLARMQFSCKAQPSATLALTSAASSSFSTALSASQEQLLNVVPSQFGSTLATAVLQPAAVSAARSANMMPGADSREQHWAC